MENNIWQPFGPRNVQVIAIDLGESASTVNNWAAGLGLTYPFVLDPGSIIWPDYGDGYIPYNVVLDTNNVVRFTNSGYNESAILNLVNNYKANVYCENLALDGLFVGLGSDSLHLTADLVNPSAHSASLKAIAKGKTSGAQVDVPMFDDGLHGDGAANDATFGGYITGINTADNFGLRIRTRDLTEARNCYYNSSQVFTTNGPLVFDSADITDIVNNIIFLKLRLRNDGPNPVSEVRASISSNDPAVTNIVANNQYYGNIGSGQTAECMQTYFIYVTDVNALASLNLDIAISSNGTEFWYDNTDMALGLERNDDAMPHEFALAQNYPNPFNPTTTISFALPQTEFVTLKIFNQVGETVATLVSNNLSAGSYNYEWNAESQASGVYYYTITAGDFRQTKKLVLMK